MKKIVSVILGVLLTFSVALPTAFAAIECTCDETPIIYVKGRTSVFVDPKLCDATGDPINPELPYVEDGRIEAEAKRMLSLFLKAYISGNYSEWAKEFIAVFADIYSDYALNEDGELANNSGIAWSWDKNTLPDIHKKDHELIAPRDYEAFVQRYFFRYDLRLCPLKIADELHEYIETVKQVTGHKKVKLLSRCLGTSITAAYFTKYGYDDIESVILYNPIMNGTLVTDALFTGDLYLNGDSLDYFATQELGSDPLMDFIKSTITLLNHSNTIDIPLSQMNKILKKLAPMVVPDILRVSYGTMPGYWAMVSPDKYEKAKEYIFGAEELKTKYAKLIAKNDEYQNKVSKNIYSLFKQMENDGVKVSIVAKYGIQPYPISEESNLQSDQIILLRQQAMGTYSASIGSKLSEEYIDDATAKGTDKYISPDHIIDASTGLFPDTTWYVKNLRHNTFPAVVDKLLYNILRDNDMNVWTNPEYPQFMVYEEKANGVNSLEPITPDNIGWEFKKVRLIKILYNFFVKLVIFLKAIL